LLVSNIISPPLSRNAAQRLFPGTHIIKPAALCHIDTKVLPEVLFFMKLSEKAGALCGRKSDQAHFACTGNSFSASLNPKFFKYPAVMPFDSVQGEKKTLADLVI
jgi:hypothetical protein